MSDKPSIEPPKIRNPKVWVDPDTMRFKELYKYVSLDSIKIRQSMKNYKASLPYIGGILATCLVLKTFIDGIAHYHIFGENDNGGPFLTMLTKNNNYDYYYNREFQRMRYLSEDVLGNDPSIQTSSEVLKDLGYKIPQHGINPGIIKKSPHFKYF